MLAMVRSVEARGALDVGRTPRKTSGG
ncbi:hypothetical protein [Sphingomonas panacis]